MKKIFFIVNALLLLTTAYAQDEEEKTNANLLSIHYRVFELSPGFEIKYRYLKNQNGFGLLAGGGYVNYTNESNIKNGVYQVNGGFIKLGGVLYYKFKGGNFHLAPSAIFSISNQTITANFENNIWGSVSKDYVHQNDLNIGAELAIGLILDLSKKTFLNFEGSLGSKIKNTDNPVYNKMGLTEIGEIASLPYFTPGMGRGGYIFINFSVGFGYLF